VKAAWKKKTKQPLDNLQKEITEKLEKINDRVIRQDVKIDDYKKSLEGHNDKIKAHEEKLGNPESTH